MNKCRLLMVSLLLVLSLGLQTNSVELAPLPEDSRNDQPVLAFDREGDLWLAWASFQKGRMRIAVSSKHEAEWAAIEYPDETPNDQIEPCLTILSSGEPCLVYSAFDGSRWRIRRTIRGRNGWSSPLNLEEGIHPTAASSKNSLWSAWENGSSIRIDKWNMAQAKSQSFDLDPGAQGERYGTPQLSSGTDGSVWIAWTSSRLGRQSVLLKRLDAEGRPIMVADEGEGVNRDPRISVDSLGRAWIVYEKMRKNSDEGEAREKVRPVYHMDQIYSVEFPSRVVRVTDGVRWWSPVDPESPAPGLLPSLLCARSGQVYVFSRSFVGFTRPFRYFRPLCESLGPKGWTVHNLFAEDGESYKTALSAAEDLSGRIWMAWARHDRERKGAADTPSWSQLDGPDKIAVAHVPDSRVKGFPVLRPLEKRAASPPPSVAAPRYQISYGGGALQVYFGDLHQHTEFSGCGRLNGRMDQNQRYTRDVRGLDFMSSIDHAEHLNDHNWRMIQLNTEMHNRTSDFVSFTGFEWTSEFDAGGNLYRGHYNAVFRDVGKGDAYFSASDPSFNTPLELWQALKQTVGGAKNVLTFAHHTGRRLAWLSWNYYDPEIVPLIEIAQARGSYEYEGSFSGPEVANDYERVRGHYIKDGLDKGMRWGFAASGDHGGRQLIAVLAPSLDRNAVFDALRAKRAYATTGERIFLDVRLNRRLMGEEVVVEGDGPRKIEVRVIGTKPITEVDLMRNGRSIKKWALGSLSADISWLDKEPLSLRENGYYVRILQRDGAQAWSSPIWLINTAVPGEFDFQVGGDELRVVYPEQETDFAVLMHNSAPETVAGTVFLETPRDWLVKEKDGIRVSCPPGGWQHAVFNVTVPRSAVPGIFLPEVKTRIRLENGGEKESSLFVVASPHLISRERKAALIDGRGSISGVRFGAYFKSLMEIWADEDRQK